MPLTYPHPGTGQRGFFRGTLGANRVRLFEWKPPAREQHSRATPAVDRGAALLAGVGNGIAQFWWTRSLSLAPPSAVVPFNYLSLVWATILGFALWGDVTTSRLLL